DLALVLERVGLPDGAFVGAGDNILRFSLRPFWRAFVDGAENRVLALHEPSGERLRRTGVLELGEQDRVLRLHEKPDEPPSTWACPPFYCLGRSALGRVRGYLAAGRPPDEIGRFIADLARHETVRALRITGERLDVGSPESYRRADAILRREPVIPHQHPP
ncbi:MAG: nucleotidyltransferase, partial [bacterium]|nr:nucleotidyltransferase [bacterium]